jgi:hypothetical protein
MNHQPFENWLLDDDRLTAQQERELQIHLRSCTTCSAIAASNLALHAGSLAAPVKGFDERFKFRLRRWRQLQVRRQAFGSVLLALAGLLALYALAGPATLGALRSPGAWLTQLSVYLVAMSTILGVIAQVSRILLRDAQALLPQTTWWWSFIIGAAGGALWAFVMRRLSRAPQGV